MNATTRGIHDFQAGDKVRLSARFLRSSGQIVGGEGSSRWTILEIQGDHAVVNEPSIMEWTPGELEADPSLKWRRINVGNLVKIGTRSARDLT